MIENQSDRELDMNKSINEAMGIDLLHIGGKIIAIRKTLYKAAVVGIVLGIIVWLSVPNRYTVIVTLSPEMGNAKGNNGLAGLAASFLGDATTNNVTDALNVSLSADIISSTPFLLELLEMKIITGKNKKITLATYLDELSVAWWNYFIGLPSTVIGGAKSWFVKVDTINNKSRTLELTKKEAEKIEYLRNNMFAVVDKKTAITSISVTLQEPKVAAIVADSVVQKLQEYITNYRTSKAKEDCAYLEDLFKERQLEYYVAQKKYADYVDTHDDLILQSIRTEQERLQSDMNLAYQVYSQVASQLQVARAKVQEEKPVFAVVEPAVVPLFPSGTGAKGYVLLFLLLTVTCTAFWVLVGKKNVIKLKTKN